MTAGAGDTSNAVQAELWISFVSLLRSYVAAHEIGVREADRCALSEAAGSFSIRCGPRLLVIEGGSGQGRWTLTAEDEPAAQGSFRVREDGMVEFSDRKGALDLEVAAEALTARIFDS